VMVVLAAECSEAAEQPDTPPTVQRWHHAYQVIQGSPGVGEHVGNGIFNATSCCKWMTRQRITLRVTDRAR